VAAATVSAAEIPLSSAGDSANDCSETGASGDFSSSLFSFAAGFGLRKTCDDRMGFVTHLDGDGFQLNQVAAFEFAALLHLARNQDDISPPRNDDRPTGHNRIV